MSSIAELNASIAAMTAANTESFGGIADALTELAEDVERLNQHIAELTERVNNPDLNAQITALNEEAAATSARASSVAQAIRDAIETPVADPPPDPGSGTGGEQ